MLDGIDVDNILNDSHFVSEKPRAKRSMIQMITLFLKKTFT